MFISETRFGIVYSWDVFYGISTPVGYLIPNPVYMYETSSNDSNAHLFAHS